MNARDRGNADCTCGHRWGVHLEPTYGRGCFALTCRCPGYEAPLLDRQGEVIDFTCCGDIDVRCCCPRCWMDSDLEAAYYGALFARQRREREDAEALFEQDFLAAADFALDELENSR